MTQDGDFGADSGASFEATGERALDRLGAGSVLVAGASLRDPNFVRTVIFLVQHGESGSLGVVLNRTSDLAVADLVPRWHDHVSAPRAVYVGGPVDHSAALALGVLTREAAAEGGALEQPGLRPVTAGVALVDLDGDPAMLAPQLRGMRVFLGYTGWGADQLVTEVRRQDWYVLAGAPDDVITPAGRDTYAGVLRRQAMPLRMLATYPRELERN